MKEEELVSPIRARAMMSAQPWEVGDILPVGPQRHCTYDYRTRRFTVFQDGEKIGQISSDRLIKMAKSK